MFSKAVVPLMEASPAGQQNDRTEEQSEALREFVKNAEDNFDSTKEKAVVILNWLLTQSLTTQ